MGARMRRLAPLPLADADEKERMRLCAATRGACVCVWSLGRGMRQGAWASDQRANDQGGMLLPRLLPSFLLPEQSPTHRLFHTR